MAGRCFYVSWVDLRTDPWPLWEKVRPGSEQIELEGRLLRCLPADHPQWPGVPLLEQAGPAVAADPRLGRYVWPGIPLQLDGQPCRLYTGPTISALFHPGSRFCNLAGLDAVYLLYQPERANGPFEVLRDVLGRLCEARGIKQAERRIQFVGVKGITDPTDHAAIIRAIEHWVGRNDPFDFGRRNVAKNPPRIVVNLSPGTPAMHAAWLLLRWNGALGGADSVVEFVQGDGGLAERVPGEGVPPDPLRTMPLDVLAQLSPRKGPAAQPAPGPEVSAVPLEELTCPPFDVLRQRIDHAAMLGLPILLHGERGTGKTFLAHYYHRRRQFYRGLRGEEAAPARGAAPAAQGRRGSNGNGSRERFPEKTGADNFVSVTLSEFADLETLRDTLFGWAKGSWTGADKGFDGLLGEAHGGTRSTTWPGRCRLPCWPRSTAVAIGRRWPPTRWSATSISSSPPTIRPGATRWPTTSATASSGSCWRCRPSAPFSGRGRTSSGGCGSSLCGAAAGSAASRPPARGPPGPSAASSSGTCSAAIR
jgi:hypothetical protein